MKSNEEFIAAVNQKIAAGRKTLAMRRLAMAIACATLCLCLAFTAVFTLSRPTVSTKEYCLMLDINPSICLKADEDRLVTEVFAYNEDGEAILTDQNYLGQDLDGAVVALVNQLIEDGYISEDANSVLVSLVGDETTFTEAERDAFSKLILATMEQKNIRGSVISQSLSKEKEREWTPVSEENAISPGRVALINQILAQNSLKTFDELAGLSVNELNLIRESYHIESDGIAVNGSASDLKYIGNDKAGTIALDNAGSSAATAKDTVVELDCVDHTLLYNVTFTDNNKDYRYQVNAVTGEILQSSEVEEGAVITETPKDKPFDSVGENAAVTAALAHAGMDNGSLIRCKYMMDYVEGRVIYNIYISDGKQSRYYYVDAGNGEIIKYTGNGIEADRSVNAPVIGEAAAKGIALASQGLIDGGVTKYDCILKASGDGYIYDFTYIAAGAKYTATVDALTGELLTSQKAPLAKDTAK